MGRRTGMDFRQMSPGCCGSRLRRLLTLLTALLGICSCFPGVRADLLDD
ncbi:MAG: hypothetical protein RLZZ436_2000, partial [Planctomycetota bacterium]